MTALKPFPAILFALTTSCLAARAEDRPAPLRPGVDPTFRPVLVRSQLTARAVRPGSELGLTLVFRNDGTAPATANHRVFVHAEYPTPSCNDLIFQYDHEPTVPTPLWQPQREVVDGPHMISVPATAREGIYHIHIGIFAPAGGGRLLDTYELGTVTVSRDAPPADIAAPKPITEVETASRRERLDAFFANPAAVIERSTYRLAVTGPNGLLQLTDALSGIRWTAGGPDHDLGYVTVHRDATTRLIPLGPFNTMDADANSVTMSQTLRTQQEGELGLVLHLRITPLEDPAGIRITSSTENLGASPWTVHSVRILDGALPVTDADAGYAVLPMRLGEQVFAAEGLPRRISPDTYNGQSTMAMAGMVKQGSAMLLAWRHPGVSLDVSRAWVDDGTTPGVRVLSTGITLAQGAQDVDLYPLGTGDYVTVAKAYRRVALRNGWLATWAEKRTRFPTVDRMFGAADFKPFVFVRTLPGTRHNRDEVEHLSIGYTFDEAAQCAEHLHRDLDIDQAMFVLAGWVNRGYDNQHPDVLPAAPECGGNEGLEDCARRVKQCGFLFGLHDNYQDMYEDAPSWSIAPLNKQADGTPKRGGSWAGGQAWQVCAIEQVALAARPGNLPQIKQLFDPTIFFIDTVFAWPLVECADPVHPMTRADDMAWKSRLCDLAKEHFGLFGSEEGREWAVPHSDYLEGLLSHKVDATRSDLGFGRTSAGRVIPLFPLVYGDCVNLYTHQSDRLTADRPTYALDCLLYAENAVHDFGTHLYFRDQEDARSTITVDIGGFRQTGPRSFEASYIWRTAADLTEDMHCFVHFVHPEGETDREGIAFQDDHAPAMAASAWNVNTPVQDGPRTISIPAKFQGRIGWHIGLSRSNGNRVRLNYADDVRERHYLGDLVVEGETIRFEPALSRPATEVFARADGGWAADLNRTDRCIKNTYEILSHLNRITAESPMTDHRFVSPDGAVEYSAFGEVRIWVNYGENDAAIATAKMPGLEALALGTVQLPRCGFLVASPGFVAFHARQAGGVSYPDGALFSARSLDDMPLQSSRQVRVFHGFGLDTLALCGTRVNVPREAIVRLSP